MSISLFCEGCGKTLQVREEFAGRTGKCPHCRAAVTVPAQGSGARGQGSGTEDRGLRIEDRRRRRPVEGELIGITPAPRAAPPLPAGPDRRAKFWPLPWWSYPPAIGIAGILLVLYLAFRGDPPAAPPPPIAAQPAHAEEPEEDHVPAPVPAAPRRAEKLPQRPSIGVTQAEILAQFENDDLSFTFDLSRTADGAVKALGKTSDDAGFLELIGAPEVRTVFLVVSFNKGDSNKLMLHRIKYLTTLLKLSFPAWERRDAWLEQKLSDVAENPQYEPTTLRDGLHVRVVFWQSHGFLCLSIRPDGVPPPQSEAAQIKLRREEREPEKEGPSG